MQQAEQTSDLESDVETCSRRLKAGLVGAAKVAQDLRARHQYLPQGCANIDASDLISVHVPLACVPYISMCHTSVCVFHCSVCAMQHVCQYTVVQVCATEYVC